MIEFIHINLLNTTVQAVHGNNKLSFNFCNDYGKIILNRTRKIMTNNISLQNKVYTVIDSIGDAPDNPVTKTNGIKPNGGRPANNVRSMNNVRPMNSDVINSLATYIDSCGVVLGRNNNQNNNPYKASSENNNPYKASSENNNLYKASSENNNSKKTKFTRLAPIHINLTDEESIKLLNNIGKNIGNKLGTVTEEFINPQHEGGSIITEDL